MGVASLICRVLSVDRANALNLVEKVGRILRLRALGFIVSTSFLLFRLVDWSFLTAGFVPVPL